MPVVRLFALDARCVQNIDIPTGGRALSFNSFLDGKSVTNFAWDAGAGADYFFSPQFSVGLGYRLVGVGKLETGSHFIDMVSGLNSTASPFKASHVYLNEVAISAAWHFDHI